MPAELDLNAMLYQAASYALQEVMPKAIEGDVSTLVLVLMCAITIFIGLILLVAVAAWFAGLSKRILLIAVLAASAVFFLASFAETAGASAWSMAAGIFGIACTLLSFAIAAISFKEQFDVARSMKVALLKKQMLQAAAATMESKGGEKPEPGSRFAAAKPLSKQQSGGTGEGFLKKIRVQLRDNSELALFCYAVVVQLGVLSGIIIAAPDELWGTVLFVLLIACGIIFVKSSFTDFLNGMRRFLLALAICAVLSMALSMAWLGLPSEQMLSIAYFKTRALAAFAAAFAIALLMGTKD
ncbi:MAG: hypothetical protein NTW59_01015 [Candidatus Diapherotrites archaeon]|nr:hypothetical protein [Candidatus Diapherotrites archaeon]